MTPEEIKKLSQRKAVKLEKLIDSVEERISKTSSSLTRTLLREFLDNLSVTDGRIVANFDRRTFTLLNRAFQIFRENSQAKLIKSIISDLTSILDDNQKFYVRSMDAEIERADIKRILDRRLGIAEDGTLVRHGYMSGLLDDSAVRSDVQRFIYREMFRGIGPEAFRRGIKTFIEGEPKKFGAFQKHYRTFSYDSYAQISAFTSGVYAQKLGLSHFIYNGGLIKTSRKFCIKRNAGVYSTEEAEEWKNDTDLEAIESRESYNWLLDRGGYNCRHTIDFIADEVAYALRPELRN